MTTTQANPADDGEHLCVGCGLCCGDVIFNWVPVPAEEQVTLRPHMPNAVWLEGEHQGFRLPCTAWNGCCTIYAHRPGPCVKFECQTLVAVDEGRLTLAEGRARMNAVRQARADLLAATGCSNMAEVEDLLRAQGISEDGGTGRVPAHSFEFLILQRLVDLYMRAPDDAKTRGMASKA